MKKVWKYDCIVKMSIWDACSTLRILHSYHGELLFKQAVIKLCFKHFSYLRGLTKLPWCLKNLRPANGMQVIVWWWGQISNPDALSHITYFIQVVKSLCSRLTEIPISWSLQRSCGCVWRQPGDTEGGRPGSPASLYPTWRFRTSIPATMSCGLLCTDPLKSMLLQ